RLVGRRCPDWAGGGRSAGGGRRRHDSLSDPGRPLPGDLGCHASRLRGTGGRLAVTPRSVVPFLLEEGDSIEVEGSRSGGVLRRRVVGDSSVAGVAVGGGRPAVLGRLRLRGVCWPRGSETRGSGDAGGGAAG